MQYLRETNPFTRGNLARPSQREGPSFHPVVSEAGGVWHVFRYYRWREASVPSDVCLAV
jgi:hypothetical protein